MSLAAQVREQLINSFRAELNEHVQTINNGLLALEQGVADGEERRGILENVFRAAHSLKGAARAMGVTMIEQLAHALESVLEGMQKGAFEPDAALFTACYRAVDAILSVQVSYEAGETTPPLQALQALAELQQAHSRSISRVKVEQPMGAVPKAEAEPAPAVASLTTDETIRVSVSKLDALMAHLSELLVAKIRAEQRLAQILRLQESLAAWQKEWLAVRSAYNRLLRYETSGALGTQRLDPVESPPDRKSRAQDRDATPVIVDGKVGKDVSHLLDYLTSDQDHLREVNALINTLSREYANDATHLSLVIGELEQEIKRVRMLPLSTITGPFARMVRDLAQASSKEIVLQISGGETELDKRVLEQIKDPLIHLLRNAVDHGIELPQRRLEAGKPQAGTITLAAEQTGKDVVIRVSDDGRGLDMEAIREAVQRHSGDLDVRSLSEEDLKEAIFKVGISTSPIITDLSGRGVGLDVVRRNVEALHGRVEVDSQPGKGTTFTLILPLTLTSSHGLLVRVENELFAIPHSSIERITMVKPEEIISLEGRDAILYHGRPLALVRLADVLELPRTNGTREHPSLPVVILRAAERFMAFAVDELAGEQEVVIKSLGRQLSRVGGIAGATVMGGGEVVLILNAADLIKLGLRTGRSPVTARPAPAERKPEKRARKRILVVDDSITTRTLEKNILEAAGYTVELATDGQEALGIIAVSGVPDLIVSDVVMPRLDGFALTKRLREDPRTAKVPVILVTSLESAEDKARGIEVGADAYITKSGFDQDNLLGTIAQLI